MDNQSVGRKVIDLFFNLVNAVAWVCFVAMIAVMLLQVFTRYVFNHPLPWTEEASRFTYIWAIFLGAVIAQRSRAHMTVTILIEKLPRVPQLVLQVLVELFSIAVLCAVFYGTYLQMGKTHGILASSINMSFSYIYLSLALGAGLMVLVYIYQFGIDLHELLTGKKEAVEAS